MRRAINNEDIESLKHMVYAMVVNNPDGTTARWEPGFEQVSSFYSRFKDYVEMKNKNVKTEDILRELEQPERVRGRRR